MGAINHIRGCLAVRARLQTVGDNTELALINQIQPPLAAHQLPIHASVQLWILCSLKKLHLPSSEGRNVEHSTGGEKDSVGCRERERREDWSDKNTQPWYRKDQIRGREGDGRWLIQQKWRQKDKWRMPQTDPTRSREVRRPSQLPCPVCLTL